jgi:hypothetical protein
MVPEPPVIVPSTLSGVPATDLFQLEAHGGLARWRTFDVVRATFLSGGGLLP